MYLMIQYGGRFVFGEPASTDCHFVCVLLLKAWCDVSTHGFHYLHIPNDYA